MLHSAWVTNTKQLLSSTALPSSYSSPLVRGSSYSLDREGLQLIFDDSDTHCPLTHTHTHTYMEMVHKNRLAYVTW